MFLDALAASEEGVKNAAVVKAFSLSPEFVFASTEKKKPGRFRRLSLTSQGESKLQKKKKNGGGYASSFFPKLGNACLPLRNRCRSGKKEENNNDDKRTKQKNGAELIDSIDNNNNNNSGDEKKPLLAKKMLSFQV